MTIKTRGHQERDDDDMRWVGMIDQARARDGRYTFDGNLQRPCVCGHTLADHCAGAPHECFVSTFAPYTPCDCPKFRKSKKKA